TRRPGDSRTHLPARVLLAHQYDATLVEGPVPRRTLPGRSPPEHAVDDGAGTPGGAQVVVDHLVRPSDTVAQDRGDRGPLAGVARHLVTGTTGHQRDRVP